MGLRSRSKVFFPLIINFMKMDVPQESLPTADDFNLQYFIIRFYLLLIYKKLIFRNNNFIWLEISIVLAERFFL